MLSQYYFEWICSILIAFCVFASTRLLFRKSGINDSEEQKKLDALIRNADPRLRMSSIDLAAALKRGDFTCEEIVSLYISHLKKVNRHINALAGTRFDDALKEAKQVDVFLKRGNLEDLPPLFGVPIIAKEVHEYPGMPYTSGLKARKHLIGERKCPALQRIENAGAIILASGNTSECCMWSESSNMVHGVSNNPYDIRRTCGGSSGGNAAALSALGGSFSITSDVGGSTRIPALYNGLFGHKPSGGAVANTYSHPTVRGEVERYCQLGPCTRHAKDLFLILDVISGPVEDHEVFHKNDHEREHHERQLGYMRSFKWQDPSTVNLKKLRYFVVRKQPGVELGLISKRSKCMEQAQERVVQAIETKLGKEVKEIEFSQLEKCFDIWSAMLQKASGEHTFATVLAEGKTGMRPGVELLKWLLTWGTFSDHTLPALGLAVAESISNLTPKRNEEMIRLGEELRDEINNLLGDDGVIIFPSLPNPAPFHGPLPNLLYFADYAACGIFNTLELPATAVPLGFSKERIPVGAQIVAGNGYDPLSIALAIALEDWGIAKWSPPCH